MPIQIGHSSPDFSNPLGLMSDCHRRIEMFLSALERVGEQNEPLLSSESRRALETALRYFREAAPKHTADEETSLFPRLRKHANAEVASLLSEVDRLEHEHKRADALHAEAERIGQRWLAEGSTNTADRELFSTAIAELKQIYGAHIALEDQVVFPLAERTLSGEEKGQVGREMADRRGVPVLHQIG